ncbi:MAG: radical SAM protein [Lentisphaerae bacterium]|nr:radical SAM protein [Lentisphaerota bacterium]
MEWNLHQLLGRIRSAIYFGSIPWCNYAINPLQHGRWTGRFIPKSLYIETTNHCNAHCMMCPHDKMDRKRGHMDWAVFTKIVDECAGFEGRGLNLFLHKDGEPLLDPRLFERIAYARGKLPRSRIHFNTNAALLDADKAEKILRSGLTSIVCSVDGASPETYETIRQGLRYESVRSNVEAFLERKRAAGVSLRVILQMVVGRENRHEMELYRRLWTGKADAIVFKPMHNFLVQGTALRGGEIGAQQLARCTMPFRVMLIYWNGDVGLCCWDYNHSVSLGNVRENGLLELYNSPVFARARVAMQRKSCADFKPCNICSQIYGHDGPLWTRSVDRISDEKSDG